MADVDIVREVARCVEEAPAKNRRIETALIVLLGLVSATGLSLLILGGMTRQWTMALPGGLCELAIAFPIRSLIKLRQENIRLAILPQLLRMADGRSEKKLLYAFIETLIRQVGS